LKRITLLALCLVSAFVFLALGAWQLERRSWKLDLIARVEARVHAAPGAVPPPGQWAEINARDQEYRRVRLTGRYRHDRDTLVDALTGRGPGAWVLTPLVTDRGTILVNRGFVPRGQEGTYTRPQGMVTVAGLLRLPEPGGRFLRPNAPDANVWYSRDVAAIAQARGLGAVAPFFVDAQAEPGAEAAYPLGGLTVLRFRNTHLIYALTWFALAAMAAFGAWRLFREG